MIRFLSLFIGEGWNHFGVIAIVFVPLEAPDSIGFLVIFENVIHIDELFRLFFLGLFKELIDSLM